MKIFSPTLFAMGIALALVTGADAADEPVKPEKTVAFRTTSVYDGAQRYVTKASGGGLNVSSQDITVRQVFTLVDINGGDLADGDSIQIKYISDEGPIIYWHESETIINRVRKLDDSCTFKVKFKEKADEVASKTIALQTASGKFVTTTNRSSLFTTTETQDKALVLEIVENPTIKATP